LALAVKSAPREVFDKRYDWALSWVAKARKQSSYQI